jgi:hypothetical protein
MTDRVSGFDLSVVVMFVHLTTCIAASTTEKRSAR